MEWMFMPLRRYAEFSGRSRRKEYWMWFLFNLVVTAILYSIMLASAGPAIMEAQRAAHMGLEPAAPSAGSMTGMGIAGILVFIYALAVFVPNLAVMVRRLHDQDKTGWLVLLILVPAIGPLILLVFMLMEGTRGDNKYGPDPKAAERTA